jgi:hypothetical protein
MVADVWAKSAVSYVTFQDLVATLNGSIGRYISMTNLHVNLTRLILEDASVLTDEEIDEVRSTAVLLFDRMSLLTGFSEHQLAMLQDGAILMSTSHDFKRCLAQAHLIYRRSSAAMEARVALRESAQKMLLYCYPTDTDCAFGFSRIHRSHFDPRKSFRSPRNIKTPS